MRATSTTASTRRRAAALLAAALSSHPAASPAEVAATSGEFQINTSTSFDQSLPSVAATGGGGFVVAWQSYSQDAFLTNGIVARRFGSTGAALGTEFITNAYTTGSQDLPDVGATDDGRFVVVWRGPAREGPLDDVNVRQFDSAGDPDGEEMIANSYTTGAQVRPAVAVVADGSFVVVWDSSNFADTQDGDGTGVFGQLFDSDGALLGTEFQVNTYTTSNQYASRVSAAPNGAFLVVWHSTGGADGNGLGTFGRSFDSVGAPQGSEFQVNTYTTSFQYTADVAHFGAEAFVVVWASNGPDGDGATIAARVFDTAGAALGDEFVINAATTGSQYQPRVDGNADGFVVVWTSRTTGTSSVVGRAFNSAALPRGGDFEVSTYTTDDRGHATVANLGDGRFVVGWRSNEQDGSGAGVFARLFEVETTTTTTSTTTSTTTTLPADPCGDPVASSRTSRLGRGTPAGIITSSDALFVLRAAIDLEVCAACVCDIDGSGAVAASDALYTLAIAVGQMLEPMCPPCT